MNHCCRHHRDARAPPKQLQTPPMQVPEPAFFPQYPIIINHDHLTSPSVSVIHPRAQWNYAPTNHPRPSPTPTIIFLRMSPYQKSWLGIVRANMLVGVRADPGCGRGGPTSISHWRVGLARLGSSGLGKVRLARLGSSGSRSSSAFRTSFVPSLLILLVLRSHIYACKHRLIILLVPRSHVKVTRWRGRWRGERTREKGRDGREGLSDSRLGSPRED